MARIVIMKRDGTPSPFFRSDKDDGRLKRVYRETSDGRIQRSRSIRYDPKVERLIRR